MLKTLLKQFFGQADVYIDLNETDGILYPKFKSEMVMARLEWLLLLFSDWIGGWWWWQKNLHKLWCYVLTWATGLCGRSIYSTALLVGLHEQIFLKMKNCLSILTRVPLWSTKLRKRINRQCNFTAAITTWHDD